MTAVFHCFVGPPDHERLSSSPISSGQPVLAQRLGDAGETTIVGYQGQLGRQCARGDQQIVAAHRLIGPPAIDYVGRHLERQHVKHPENRLNLAREPCAAPLGYAVVQLSGGDVGPAGLYIRAKVVETSMPKK